MSVPEATLPHDRIISPRIVARRERLLPGPGHLLISQGSRVEPTDVVAETQESGSIQVLDGARGLGIAPNKVPGCLQVQEGDEVQEGQVLAKRGGLFRRTLVSPSTGTLALVDERGYLLIRGLPIRHQVQAMMHGEVVKVMSGRGVVIEGQGALVQGVWGNGKESYGLLRLMVGQPHEMIPTSHLNAGLRSTILIAGMTVDAAVLEQARAIQVRGLIVGSLDAALLPLAREMPYAILITEGFGSLPYSEQVFSVLATLDGRDANLNALHTARQGRSRPELFAPLSGSAPPPVVSKGLTVGDRVRVLAEPYLAQLGTIQSLGEQRHTLPNGINVPVCEVRLVSGEALLVPYPNLERLLL